jgi:hypothetical protein
VNWNSGHNFKDACRLWRICNRAVHKAHGRFPQPRRELEFIDLPEWKQAAFAEAAWVIRHQKGFATTRKDALRLARRVDIALGGDGKNVRFVKGGAR